MNTVIGFLRRGDIFIFDGKKYKIRNLILDSNGIVACVDIESKKIKRFHIDTDVEIEEVQNERGRV